MNNFSLVVSALLNRTSSCAFKRVYPSDQLPTSVSSYPALFIANVDTSEKPGSHWVAFYFTKDKEAEFFDSYGLPPSNYTGTFTSFLNNNSSSWKFNTLTLQSMTSKVCGHYGLYFALFRCRNISMSSIVYRFSNNKQRNDFLVKHFIEKHFPVIFQKKKTSHSYKQTSSESTASSSINTL